MTKEKKPFIPTLGKDQLFSKQWFYSYGMLVLGTLILSIGYAFFMAPYKIVPGGIYGISIVLHHQFGFPLGLAALCFNLPLTLIGLRILGPKFGVKTFVCFILTAFFTDGVTWLSGHYLGTTDPLGLGEEIVLASVFGGIVIGIGVGLIFKSRASSGGTDVLASILNKYTRIPLGQQLMIIDCCIVLIGLAVFKDWKVPFYSWITIFIMGKVIDTVVEGFSSSKTVFIVSEKSEQIRHAIINDLKRGGTILDGHGMYNFEKKNVLFCVLSRKEMADLQVYVHAIDPNAFMAVLDASEILGHGFKTLDEKMKK